MRVFIFLLFAFSINGFGQELNTFKLCGSFLNNSGPVEFEVIEVGGKRKDRSPIRSSDAAYNCNLTPFKKYRIVFHDGKGLYKTIHITPKTTGVYVININLAQRIKRHCIIEYVGNSEYSVDIITDIEYYQRASAALAK